jgi:AcrR family transcriptional regulator
LRDVIEKAGKLSEKVAEKLTEQAAKQQQLAAKSARRAETLDQLASQLGAIDVWTRAQPGGRRPRFTRDDIAAAAVRIADAEGFGALSMRRLATELDAGTMTLYHYVRTKDELLALVTDAVMGEVVLGDDETMPAEWRDAMTVVANRTRDALRRHPWILDITDDPAVGPNSVRHFDQSLQAMSSVDVDLAAKLDVVTAVDEYVFGYCLMERNNMSGDGAIDDHMVEYVSNLIDTGDYPALSALSDEIGLEKGWEQIEAHQRDETRFRRSLDRLLAGIAASL